jgi:hypothetical protein
MGQHEPSSNVLLHDFLVDQQRNKVHSSVLSAYHLS